MAAAAAGLLGHDDGALRILIGLGQDRRRRDRSGARLTARQRAKRGEGPKRLNMARGAGSINARADALQLAALGRYREALKMAEDHQRQCGEHLFLPFVLHVWHTLSGS